MADRLRQVLLEAFSNSGRPLGRADRAHVMAGNFRAKDRRWNGAHGIGPRSKHRRHRPGVRGALAVEHIYELGESPPTREAGTPVGVTFGLATVNRIRGSLLPGAVCSPIPNATIKISLCPGLQNPLPSPRHAPGGVKAQRDRRPAVLPVQEPGAHGFAGGYRAYRDSLPIAI